jgi:hypothetical protein
LYQGPDFCKHGEALVGACIMVDPLDARKCFAIILRTSKKSGHSNIWVRIGMTMGALTRYFSDTKEIVTIV